MAAKPQKPPWERERPAKPKKSMSAPQKAEAKRRAKKAGRPYPNLVDNLAATKTSSRKKPKK